ncbi:MAG: ABC transporter permease subunit [bacterium]|nr:ABC transporter permease subunit [bacterium]
MTDATITTADREPRALPTLTALLSIAVYSVREMARRRRLISLGLLCSLPVIAVLVVRIFFPEEGITPHQQLAALSHDVIIPLLIPIVAMAVGASAIGEQVEEGTIVYLWTRPIRRRAIYLGRLLAAQTVAAVLLSLALAACFLIMISNGLQVVTFDFLKLYLTTFLLIALGAFTYTSLFAAFGTWFRKPVLPGIIFAFGWENLITNIPARVQEFSLRFHLQNLVERPPVSDTADLPGLLGALLTAAFKRDPVPALQSVAVLVVVGVVAALVGIWMLRNKELEK